MGLFPKMVTVTSMKLYVNSYFIFLKTLTLQFGQKIVLGTLRGQKANFNEL